YEGRDPLYVWARSQTELLDALLMVEDPPGPVPVVDFSTQSVVVAVTGAFFDGAGQRTVEVASACPGPNGMAVTIRRGDPISGCPPNPGRSAPYAVAIVDDASLNVSFVEEQIDTCEPGGCVGVVWTSLLSDDAAEHYTGPPIATMVTNQTSYEAAAQPLVGNNPLPAIDFQTEVGIVISSGYSEVGFGARYTYVRDICHDEAADTLNVDWVAGEYETCPPPDLPPSAPFEIVAVDQRAAQAAFNAFTEDICGPPPPCDNAADYLLIAQADVQGVATAEAGAKVLSDQASFDAEWAKYFPEVDAPPVEFASRDVFIIAGPETSGSGTQRLVLESICFEPADNTLTVDYTRWNPMSPFCAKVDGIPSRPVLVLSTIRYESGPATVFTENLADICESPSCLGPPAELLASGDAAGTWTGGAQDLVIYDAATLRELWIATHSDGSNPPDVDFTTYAVAFSTSGHHDVGLGQYGIRHRDYCPFDISGAVNVRWLVPETCPQPEPVPTAPFVFSLLFNDSGGPGGRNAWYTFPKTTSDYCDPAANCFPAPWSFLDGGDYPDNTNALAYIEAFDNAADWQTAWNTFFSNPDTRPPLPDVDFTRSDALLYGIGFSPSGVGQRSTFPFDVCIDEQAMRLKVSASNGVPETCKPNDGGSHPWAAITVPKGSADLTLLTGFQTFDTCFENCFEYREVGTGLDALWMAPEPQYTLIADLDFRQRQQAYRDVWSQIGTGDPPGIDEMTEFDAVVVLIHGWRGSGRGSWQVELNRYCLAAGGLDIGVTRLGPYGGCNVIQVPTSPWAVYFAPLIDQTGTFDEIEVDTCP
ncbi:MAG TPA: hypothetical protein VEI97_20875, partial [bacterium]|nr:hypothetical protein [bacterium]